MQSQLEIIDHKFLTPGHTHMECDTDHSIIEKKRKKYNHPIEHPRDWYQLVRLCGNKKPFIVHEMKNCDFHDFASTLKKTFQVRKNDENGDRFVWKEIKWLQYRKSYGQFYYKKSLNQDEPFKTMSFLRRGQSDPISLKDIPNCKPTAITVDKKIIYVNYFLIPIDPIFHDFYKNLRTQTNLLEILPDIEEGPHDDDDNDFDVV